MRMEWLYPELRQIEPKEREAGLLKAKEYSFDTVEIAGLAVALAFVVVLTNLTVLCAVERRCLPAGANPVRQLSLQPVAIGAIVEVTKRLKPSV